MTGADVLDLPMTRDNDAEAKTIRCYFKKLLTELWIEGEGFDGKRPLGNSGWEYDLYYALIDNKVVKAKIDEYGDIEDIPDKELKKANKFIIEAIAAL